jgi:Xaa-Pro dipeptidase
VNWRREAMRGDAPPIDTGERQRRIERAQSLMQARGVDAIWLDVSTSLAYFTGLRLGRSERLHGAILPARGGLTYLSPAFEVEKLKTMITMPGEIAAWDEHEDPTALVIDTLRKSGIARGRIGIDEATPFASFDGLRRAGNSFDFVNASLVTAACRQCKTEREIALMQTAKDITLEVHKAAARILPRASLHRCRRSSHAHARLGAEGPPAFNIVLFGEVIGQRRRAYPVLKDGDMVLIDIGAPVDGYLSDITRTYVFGAPTARQRQIWNLGKARSPPHSKLQARPPRGVRRPQCN